MKTFLVIGVGRFGRHLCQKLSGLGYEVMAIDTDEEEIEHVLPYTVNSMIGDGTNKEFIRSLGCIPNFKDYNGYPASICTSVNEEVVLWGLRLLISVL